MVFLALGVKKAMSGSGTGCMGRKREDELSIFEPRNAMLCGIELVDVIDERILCWEFFEVNNQRLWGAVQVTFNVEERATQRIDEFAGEGWRQPLSKRCTCIIHQASQPPHELRRTSVEPRMMAIGATLVVATGNGIEGLTMDLHAKALFVMLPEAKGVQHIACFPTAAGIQRMPAVLFWSADHLSADNRAHGLLLGFALEHRPCFGDADLLRHGPLADAGFFVDRERLGRQAFPSLYAARIATSAQSDFQVLGRRGLVHQCPHVRIAFAGTGVEQRVQRGRVAVAQYPPRQQPSDIAQLDVARCGLDGDETPQVHVVAQIQFLATHELVARGHIALGDHEFLRPAGNRVLIKAHQHVLLVQQFPGARSVTETVYFVPQHVPSPGTHVVSRGTMPRISGQQGKSHVLHLVQVKNTFQPDDQGEDAGQEPPLERTVVVGKAFARRVEPREHLGPQQESPRVLGVGKKNLSGTTGTNPPDTWASNTSGVTRSSSSRDTACRASSKLVRSRPYFLRNSQRATLETWKFHVRPMKSSSSSRVASGWVKRNSAMEPAWRGKSFPYGRPLKRCLNSGDT